MFTQPTPIETIPKSDVEAIITLRDVVRGTVHRVLGREPMLRVPYDLESPDGPVEFRGGTIHYTERGKTRQAAVALSPLSDAKPGERVLVRVPPRSTETEWWLCEVGARDEIIDA